MLNGHFALHCYDFSPTSNFEGKFSLDIIVENFTLKKLNVPFEKTNDRNTQHLAAVYLAINFTACSPSF